MRFLKDCAGYYYIECVKNYLVSTWLFLHFLLQSNITNTCWGKGISTVDTEKCDMLKSLDIIFIVWKFIPLEGFPNKGVGYKLVGTVFQYNTIRLAHIYCVS